MPEMRRNVKDSVFTLMFREPKYALQLYQALHPEDKDVTEADCTIVTLENILTVGQYNDLGMLVRDRLILLVEAQAVFTLNVVLRILLYLAETYKRYVERRRLDLYGTKPVEIPRPELYMVYTGPRQDVPDVLHLSDLYKGEGPVGLDLEVTVCRVAGTEDILKQYVRFCQIADEKRKLYEDAPERAIEEVLKQCREEGILIPFLASREKEVRDIMSLLFSEEWIRETHDYNTREEGKAEGKAEGKEQTLLSSIKSLVKNLGLTIEQAMDALSIPTEARAKLQAQL